MKKSTKVPSVSIHSSAAEYLTYVAAVGNTEQSFEMRYENENVWLTQKNDGGTLLCKCFCHQSAR